MHCNGTMPCRVLLSLSSLGASSALGPSALSSSRRSYPCHGKAQVCPHQRRTRSSSRQVQVTRRPCSPATPLQLVSGDTPTINMISFSAAKSGSWRIPARGGPSRDQLGSHRTTLRDTRRRQDRADTVQQASSSCRDCEYMLGTRLRRERKTCLRSTNIRIQRSFCTTALMGYAEISGRPSRGGPSAYAGGKTV